MTAPTATEGRPFATFHVQICSELSVLSSCGSETQARIADLEKQTQLVLESLGEGERPEIEAEALESLIGTLVHELRERWSGACVAQALFFVDGHLKQSPPSLRYIAENIEAWLRNHTDEPKNFNYCLQISPPAGIAIERVLNAGAQKQVFVASWPEVTPHKVAFKRFHDPEGAGSGDAFSHPLRGHHPNIIETFPLGDPNNGDDVYLVERLLPTTLSYGWKFGGLGEVVNLVRDIAHALSFVHAYNRIHGDIKLENIGFEDFYILLDFGLCRSEPTHSYAWTPTGNVRGLAPELLHGKANTAASDVWALGSVAFATLTGRPPYFKAEEKQHGFVGSDRVRTLERLAERADDSGWREENRRRIESAVPELQLQQILGEMLAPNPDQRPSARRVFERCSECLGQYLRPVQTVMMRTPDEELSSLFYLQEAGGLALASKKQRAAIRDTATRFDESKVKSTVNRARLSELRDAI